MKLIKVAAAVVNQTPIDWENNFNNIKNSIEEAKKDRCSILLFPELSITGYGCEDAFLSIGIQNRAFKMLKQIAKYCDNIIVAVGLPLMYQNGIYNTSALIVDKKIVGFVAKRHLAGDGLHYEPRWFKEWPEDIITEIAIDDEKYPIGDIIFNISGVKIGFEICEDAWVAKRPGGTQASRGVDIILNPSASHFAFDKVDIRKGFVIEGSRAFNVSYIYTNLLGNEAGRAIYDGDALIATDGELIARGSRFSFKNHFIISAVIDVAKTRMKRSKTASYHPEIVTFDKYISHNFNFIDQKPVKKSTIKVDKWELNDRKQEEFTRAETLALFDYLRKSYSKGFVVSLSGGADSAAVSIVVNLMVKLAVKELGVKQFLLKLSHIKQIQNLNSVEDIVSKLLLTAYQGTKNSSKTTLNAAEKVAKSLGATFYNLDIDSIVNNYIEIVEKAIKRDLTWDKDDITLQNIQARVRSPSIWMFANIKQFLLLSTSNRSEAAVGYATMDGDTSGGISPIAGIDKAFLREWLIWIEKKGGVDFKPIKEIKYINEQQPTAELRPQNYNQTDEDDLMPYPILDKIERLSIRDKLLPDEVVEILLEEYSNISKDKIVLWVKKFFRLWSRNQWKRERYAPSFHLDDENLDPKTWCRFPILSGGFKEELDNLDK